MWCSVAHDGVPSVHRAKAGGLPGLRVTPEQRGTQVIVYIQTLFLSYLRPSLLTVLATSLFFLHQLAWLLDMAMELTDPREKHTAMTKIS